MKPKAKQFRGWRQLGPRDVLRSTDRWTYSPKHFRSPAGMFEVPVCFGLCAGRRLGSEHRWTYSPEHFRSPAGMFEVPVCFGLCAGRRLGSEQAIVVYRREEK